MYPPSLRGMQDIDGYEADEDDTVIIPNGHNICPEITTEDYDGLSDDDFFNEDDEGILAGCINQQLRKGQTII